MDPDLPELPELDAMAPDFTLPDQDGKEHSLSDYRGQWVLLYFYPKDNTTGCTKEACMIRDAFPHFEDLKMKVIGVSIDPVESHKKFADEHNLPFTLLADTHKEVVKKYGVWATFMGRSVDGTARTSFLIDPMGEVEKIYTNVKPEKHAADVLADMRLMQE